MIILDTSGLLAALDASQRHHAAAVAALREANPPWVLSPFVLAELEYLLARRRRIGRASTAVRVGRGVYRLESFQRIQRGSRAGIAKYTELEIGLADASIVVLATRYGVRDLLTLDERHFRAHPRTCEPPV